MKSEGKIRENEGKISRKVGEKSVEISPLLRELLAKRGVKTDTEISDFLNPDFAKTCYDPLLFPDMKRAVSRIREAKKRGEKITIYGDYDIDGMTATVILWEALNRFGLDCDTYTPDRFTEGYGLNKDAISRIADAGAKLIITVDNGTLSFDEVDFAKTLGVDVIVTDHHSPHETLPAAVAVINPKIMPARFPEFYDSAFRLREDVFREKLKITEKNSEQKICSRGHKWTLGETCFVCNPGKIIREDYAKFSVDFAKISDDEKRVFAKMFYLFCDPCGAGTAFILVRALQNDSLENEKKFAKFELDFAKNKNDFREENLQNPYFVPLAKGQEKWFLDLVALGTVCDIVGLVDENRNNVKWGIEVMKRTRRPGVRALLAIAGVKITEVDSETLGFVLGPRLNAAGRMETAEYALELLKLHDAATAGFARQLDGKTVKTQDDVNTRALELATKLEELNKARRKIQDEVFANAVKKVDENFAENYVLVVDGDDWHEGIIGIVAAKILEKYSKPTIILARGEDGFAKGSGRSFGEFSMAAVIHASDKIIERGGGHLAAGGLTVRNEKIVEFRENVQKFYSTLNLKNQEKWLVPAADLTLADFAKIDKNLLDEFAKMEPFGHANEAPVIEFRNVKILVRKVLKNVHVKYQFVDDAGKTFEAIAFSAADKFREEPRDADGNETHVNIRVNLTKNEWNGRVSIEGRLLAMEREE